MRRKCLVGFWLAPGVVVAALVGCTSQGTPTEADAASPAAGAALKPGSQPKEKASTKGQGGSMPPGPVARGFGEIDVGEDKSSAAPVVVDVPALIDGLQSRYSVRVFAATEQFRQMPPDERRKLLAELSAHEDASVRNNAWRAFATWATRDDVPTLLAGLQSPHEDVRLAALTLLARFPNDQTVGVLTKYLEDPTHRPRAEELLMSVGPAGEQALLAYIAHADAGLRASACRILGQVGTRKSLLALEQAATQGDFQKDPELKEAMEKIRERLRR